MASEIRVAVPFAQIPEWVLDHEQSGLSDKAVRLYGILHRYGNGADASRVPGRATLARRLGCSEDSIDRAKTELERVGALIVNKRPGRTNSYLLNNGSRTHAASPKPSSSRTSAESLAAPVRHDREQPTEKVEANASTPRKRDELWDTFTNELGEPVTESEKGRRRKALKQLRDIEATPQLLLHRIRAYKDHWPDIDITETAIVANWTLLAGLNGSAPPGMEPVQDVKVELQRLQEESRG